MKPFLTYLLRPLIFFAVTVVLFVIQRLCFIMFYPEIFTGVTGLERWLVVWHGLPMDCSVAAYLTAIPLILSAICVWLPESRQVSSYAVGKDGVVMEVRGREVIKGYGVFRPIFIVYAAIVSLAMAFIAILDGTLYPVWGYKLDINPFYFFFTSPQTSLGTVSGIQMFWSIVIILCVAVLWFAAYSATWIQLRYQPIRLRRNQILTFIGLVLMGGVLFVVMRGGVSVSTMNLSRAYFSSDQRLNHAAINPAFSLLSSATHASANKYDKYNFYPEARLPELLGGIAYPAMEDEAIWAGGDTIISSTRPDIVIIILESFSSHLLPIQGGENIAPNINEEAEKGLLFANAYASGFRTDRGLPAILNGFPGLPDVSITRYPAAMEHIPGLAQKLPRAYRSTFYYGGDLNFTNMKALLVSGGFKHIVGDEDFPVSQRLEKWGVQDDVLFQRVKKELKKNYSTIPSPQLTVIQTSSSHEPFNVPFRKFSNKAANAFAFTDSVVGDFLRDLRTSPRWSNTLVVLVPDHYGAYPENLPTMEERHHIPIIFTGGVLKTRGVNNSLMSQTDIAPTLLGIMGVDNHHFFFGRNVFDLRTPPMVFYYDRGEAFLKSSEGTANLNIETMEMNINPTEKSIVSSISPLNPSTQLHAWMQAIADEYTAFN